MSRDRRSQWQPMHAGGGGCARDRTRHSTSRAGERHSGRRYYYALCTDVAGALRRHYCASGRWCTQRTAQTLHQCYGLGAGGDTMRRRVGGRLLLLLAAILAGGHVASAIPIDNGVTGVPTISCGGSSTAFAFRVQKAPFAGRVFVKGHSANADCVADYTGGSNPTNAFGSAGGGGATLRRVRQETDYGMVLHFDQCGVERRRSTNPRGVFMESVVVVQFHPIFVTKVDRAYKIQCFYMEADKTVTSGIEVSMLTTESLLDSAPMPICEYSVRSGSFDGPVVRFATVGDKVWHRWQCAQPDGGPSPFGMLVHSCSVLDGKGTSVQVVDSDGCAMDPYILGHLNYAADLLTASREAHVFKFADESSMAFECQIRLCHKTMGTCRGMTPPKCAELRNRKRRRAATALVGNARRNDSDELHAVTAAGYDDFDVRTEPLVVLESDAFDGGVRPPAGDRPPSTRQASGDRDTLCVSRWHAQAAAALGLAPLCLIVTVACAALLRWRRAARRMRDEARLRDAGYVYVVGKR